MGDDQVSTLESYSTEAKANIQQRQRRVNRLAAHIGKNGANLRKKKLLAMFSLKEGVSLSTIYSYLTILFDADVIVERGDQLLLIDQVEDGDGDE